MSSRNASGIVIRPGFSRSIRWKSTDVSLIIDRLAPVTGSTLPETTGENVISTRHEINPPYMLHSAPDVLNRFQNSEYRMVGRLALAATAKASATRNATF